MAKKQPEQPKKKGTDGSKASIVDPKGQVKAYVNLQRALQKRPGTTPAQRRQLEKNISDAYHGNGN